MKWEMYQVSVNTVEETESVDIVQDGFGPNENHTVTISVDQIDALVGWLQRSKSHLLGLRDKREQVDEPFDQFATRES